ncbi:MAG: hypothetical protein KC592_04005 [Nitrospira sp.]|nr:hypothetical protein [Nitrospira sp.]
MRHAYKRVRANGGAPGVDGMPVEALQDWLAANQILLAASLRDESYRLAPVRGVAIPKLGVGVRQLGIPTVVDRLVQQAILQVLDPWLDPTFSESSYGFRPKRRAHHALHQAAQYVAEGYGIVVDVDLEQFFDRVNHDLLMARLAQHVREKRLLGLVRDFFRSESYATGFALNGTRGPRKGGRSRRYFFLGYRLREDKTLAVASQSLARVKSRIRQMTGRMRGVSLKRVIYDLQESLPGWVTYFRYEKDNILVFRSLDQWIRRRLRCYVLKRKKRSYTVACYL